MNRRGSVLDIGLAMVAVFTFVIVALTADHIYGKYATKWQNITSVNSSQASVNAVNDTKTILDTRLDYVGIVLLIGFALAIIVTGWLVPAHSIFAFIYFLVIIIFVAVSAVLSFTYNKISTTSKLSNIVANFPIMDFVLNNFPVFIAILGFIGMFVMFAKPQQ